MLISINFITYRYQVWGIQVQNTKETLSIISIQHELVMNIGLSLKLDEMLEHFLPVLQAGLKLTSCHAHFTSPAIHTDGNQSLLCMSYPKINTFNARVQQQANDIITEAKQQQAITSCFYQYQQQSYFYAFKIGDLGWLVLQRTDTPISPALLNALSSVVEKLTLSCIACLQHKSLELEIEHREQVEQVLKRQAYLDPLTALPNRKMLYQQLRKALCSAKKHDAFGALFYIDVDRFKNINDTLGHTQGDELLVAITQALQGLLTKQDTIARVGGDEFVILSEHLANNPTKAESEATELASAITALFAQPIQLSRSRVRTSVSIGIVLFPTIETKCSASHKYCEQVVHNADIAMYQVKAENRNGFQFYRKSMQEKAERYANIEKWLSQAKLEEQFEIYYQPVVDKQGQTIAAEALLRWQHKDIGFISPNEFIPIAEESGHIIALGEFVIEQACKTLDTLIKQGACLNYIAVNISPRQFQHPSFVEFLLDTLQRYHIPSCYLKLEVTEGLAIEDLDQVINKMNTLINHGFHFLLDDFGSGYSSLSYLHKLPLEAVKIDKGFISNVAEHVQHQVITNAIIDIAERLNIGCIAEGVETAKDVDYLQQKRVTAFQGYHYHKPMAKAAFFNLLTATSVVPFCINT